jgi:hypothetical protein
MASVLWKNTGGGEFYQSRCVYGPIQEMLNDDAQGVGTNLTLNTTAGSWQTMVLQTAATQHGSPVNTGLFVLSTPSSLDLIPSAATTTFDYEISGIDHFGDDLVLYGTKGGTSAANGGNKARTMRAFSAVKSVRIRRTDATAGTPTVSLGYAAATGGGTNSHTLLPLPCKLADASAIIGIQILDIKGLTITGSTNRVITAAYGGALDSANADTVLLASLNTGGATANILARAGMGAITLASYTNVLANAAPPTYRWVIDPQVMRVL